VLLLRAYLRPVKRLKQYIKNNYQREYMNNQCYVLESDFIMQLIKEIDWMNYE